MPKPDKPNTGDRHSDQEVIRDKITTDPEEPIVGTAYVTDNNGDLVLDENGNPIPVHSKIFAGDGNDIITDDAGENLLKGENGNDTITGGIHRDVVDGGNDNDILDGGADYDLVTGGAGDDVLIMDLNDLDDWDPALSQAYGGLDYDRYMGDQGNDTWVIVSNSTDPTHEAIVNEVKNSVPSWNPDTDGALSIRFDSGVEGRQPFNVDISNIEKIQFCTDSTDNVTETLTWTGTEWVSS